MKNTCYLLIIIIASIISSCGIKDPKNYPPCDNSMADAKTGLSLNWNSMKYSNTGPIFNGVLVPTASGNNYLSQSSYTGPFPSASFGPNSYLCTVVCMNTQQEGNINEPCNNPGSITAYWTAGATFAIQTYKYFQTEITVDYYDVCSQCTASVAGNCRPHFRGMIVLPKQVTPVVAMAPYQQSPLHTDAYCQ